MRQNFEQRISDESKNYVSQISEEMKNGVQPYITNLVYELKVPSCYMLFVQTKWKEIFTYR